MGIVLGLLRAIMGSPKVRASRDSANTQVTPGGLKKHYTKYVDNVKRLKRSGKLEEAEELLLRCVEATEAESMREGLGVAPWYYEQLAIIYRKRKDVAAEVAILER